MARTDTQIWDSSRQQMIIWLWEKMRLLKKTAKAAKGDQLHKSGPLALFVWPTLFI